MLFVNNTWKTFGGKIFCQNQLQANKQAKGISGSFISLFSYLNATWILTNVLKCTSFKGYY